MRRRTRRVQLDETQSLCDRRCRTMSAFGDKVWEWGGEGGGGDICLSFTRLSMWAGRIIFLSINDEFHHHSHHQCDHRHPHQGGRCEGAKNVPGSPISTRGSSRRRPAAVTVKVSPSLPPYSDLCGSSEHLPHRFRRHLHLFHHFL